MHEIIYNFMFCSTPESILNNNSIEIRDVKDAPVLYSSIISNVDILITSDKDFDDIDIEKPEILTPTQFLDKYS